MVNCSWLMTMTTMITIIIIFFNGLLFFWNGLPPNPTFQPLRAEKTTYYARKLLRTCRGIYQGLPTIEYNIGN